VWGAISKNSALETLKCVLSLHTLPQLPLAGNNTSWPDTSLSGDYNFGGGQVKK